MTIPKINVSKNNKINNSFQKFTKNDFQTSIYINKEIYKKIKIYCAQQNIKINSFIINAIENKLADIEKQ